MPVLATGSKVIFDLTDTGRLFVTITANHLRTQVESKDSNGNTVLTPNWQTTPLVLTPVVYFDNQSIPLNTSGLSVTWKKRSSAQQPANLGSGEAVSNKVLTVSANTLSNATGGMIAYLATVKYTVASVSYTETAEIDFSRVVDGVDGTNGTNGNDGESIASITNYYLASASSSGVKTTTSGWTTTIQTISASKPYLWNYEVVTGSKGTTLNTTTPCIIGRYGKDGTNGTNGANGNDGRGISSIAEHFKASNSNATAPTSWSDTIETTTATNKYLWYYETVTYTDGSSVDTKKRVIGTYGDKGDTGNTGVSVASITNYYLASASSSGVTTSTSGWKTTVQTMSADKPYLWNYEVVKGSDNSTLNTTTPCIIGRFGKDGTNGTNGTNGNDGRGIVSIAEHYQISSSATTAPTTWSDTMVNTTTSKKYLWNYETITYTDNTTEDSTKRVIGTHGATGSPGAPGAPGEDGRSITAAYTQYHIFSDKETPPDANSAGWTSDMPVWQRGVYLWLRMATEYSDGTTEYSTPTCDATWETVLDAVEDIDVLKGQWAKADTDGNRVLTTDDLLEGYAINLFIQKEIPQFTQEGTGYPSGSNVRPIHPYQGFTVHQTGCTVLPALDSVSVKKSTPQTVVLPYAIPAGSYKLSATFSKNTYATTVELYTSDGNGGYAAMENNPSITSATPSASVIARDRVTALRISVASGATTSYACAVTNIRMVPVGCEDDGRDPRHKEMFISIPEIVGGGVLNTEYQNIQADWVIIPDVWKHWKHPEIKPPAQSTSQSTSGGSSSGGTSGSSSGSGSSTPSGDVEVVEEPIEDITVEGEIFTIAVPEKIVRSAFDSLYTTNLTDAKACTASNSAEQPLYDPNTGDVIPEAWPVRASHMRPATYSAVQIMGLPYGYEVICPPEESDRVLFFIRLASYTDKRRTEHEVNDWLKTCSESGHPVQVALKLTESMNVYAGRTPKLASFRGHNNIWIDGGAISFRIAGGSDIASITDAIARLQERQDAIREAQLTLHDDVIKLQTKTQTVEFGDDVWTTTTVGLQPGEFGTTISTFTDATGLVENHMSFDPEGLKLHSSNTPYYTLITEDGFQIRKGFVKAEGASQYTDPEANNLPASAYFNDKGEYIVTGEGQAQYTVKASFRADGAYLPRAHVTDVLSLGKTNFGWYGVQVVAGGLGFVWRDGLSGYIISQPVDCQISAAGNAVRFRVEAANIAEYQWQVSTSYNSQGFPVWANVSDETATKPDLIYTPPNNYLNGNARWRCVLTDQTNTKLYTAMCIATVAGS